MQLRDSKTAQKVWWNTGFYLWCWALWSAMGAGQAGCHLQSLPGMWGYFPHWAHREAFVSNSPTAKSVQVVFELQFLCPNFFIKIKMRYQQSIYKSQPMRTLSQFSLREHRLAYAGIHTYPVNPFPLEGKSRWNPLWGHPLGMSLEVPDSHSALTHTLMYRHGCRHRANCLAEGWQMAPEL